MHEVSKEFRKGFLKMIVLKIISKKPIHGYDIIQIMDEKSHGRWVPSPGSIYPILDFLESKRFITMEEVDRKKVYTITDEGKKALETIDERRRAMIQDMNAFFGDTEV